MDINFGADMRGLRKSVDAIHDKYPKWTRDNAFVYWFLSAFFLMADEREAVSGITGKSNDKNVDAIWIDDQNEKVCIIQGKFHEGPNPVAESRPDLLDFARLAGVLFGDEEHFNTHLKDLDPGVSHRLKDCRKRLLKRKYTLDLYFVTTGNVSSALVKDAASEVRSARGRGQIRILVRRDILRLLEDYNRGAAPPVPVLTLPIDNRDTSDGRLIVRNDQAFGIRSWIFAMRGIDVGKIFSSFGDRVFARNIRGFLDETRINTKIAQTLHREPGHFWYFNNGVTIICDAAERVHDGQALEVRNPQIINGQQTTRTLADHAHSGAASVLVKVFSFPRESTKDSRHFEQLVSKVVAATNWQNAISAADLRSNDREQVVLERNLKLHGYAYLRKRESKGESARRFKNMSLHQIPKEELAKIVAACDLNPAVVRDGVEGMFDYEKPHYARIFDDRSVEEYLSRYWIGRIARAGSRGYPERGYARWHVTKILWEQISPSLNKKIKIKRFVHLAERNKFLCLDRLANELYRAALRYYRINRGSGEKAIDVSHFFYAAVDKLDRKLGRFVTKGSTGRSVRAEIRRFRQEIKKE